MKTYDSERCRKCQYNDLGYCFNDGLCDEKDQIEGSDTMPKFEVGQYLYYKERTYTGMSKYVIKRTKITKVGSKYVYILGGKIHKEQTFHGGYPGPCNTYYLSVKDIWDAEIREEVSRQCYCCLRDKSCHQYSLDTWNQIAKLLGLDMGYCPVTPVGFYDEEGGIT